MAAVAILGTGRPLPRQLGEQNPDSRRATQAQDRKQRISIEDPGADTEAQYSVTITKRWFRAKVAVTGTDPYVTCWAVGFLEMRLS